MNFLNLIFCVFMFHYTFGNETSVKSKMQEYGVVPDVIDEAPNTLLQVTYSSDVKAELGNELTPEQVLHIPKLDWNPENNAHYTVLMTDPDLPADLGEFRHWLIVNIPGNDVSSGKSIYDYLPPTPPKGTGLHRYVFLVFKQPHIIEQKDISVKDTSNAGRVRSKARNLIKKYNLGLPVAGNFFRSQFKVPILDGQ